MTERKLSSMFNTVHEFKVHCKQHHWFAHCIDCDALVASRVSLEQVAKSLEVHVARIEKEALEKATLALENYLGIRYAPTPRKG